MLLETSIFRTSGMGLSNFSRPLLTEAPKSMNFRTLNMPLKYKHYKKDHMGTGPCLFGLSVVGKTKAQGRNIISRAKSNISAMNCGDIPFDADDPVNAGVVGNRIGGFSYTRSTIRIIDYINPETGEEMTFYTTLNHNIRPGVICWLYFLRWKIEKAFDCFKNELGERKAWATGKNALQIQGYSICIIYNFILFLSETIQKKYACTDRKAEKKYHDYLKKRKALSEAHGRFIHPLLFLRRSISRISCFEENRCLKC